MRMEDVSYVSRESLEHYFMVGKWMFIVDVHNPAKDGSPWLVTPSPHGSFSWMNQLWKRSSKQHPAGPSGHMRQTSQAVGVADQGPADVSGHGA